VKNKTVLNYTNPAAPVSYSATTEKDHRNCCGHGWICNCKG